MDIKTAGQLDLNTAAKDELIDAYLAIVEYRWNELSYEMEEDDDWRYHQNVIRDILFDKFDFSFNSLEDLLKNGR